MDYTIIEILKEDDIFKKINNYFEIDDYIMNNESQNNYKDQDICIVQYPDGGELSFAQGGIQCFDDYKIKHLVSTHHGSSGSPILLQNNFQIIGIHKAGNTKKNENIGIFFQNILNHFLLENNFIIQIICEYDIKNKNEDIQILNCYEEVKKQDPKDFNWELIEYVENEKEIKDKSELYLNNQKIQFCFKYKFEKEGKNTINIIFNNLLKNTNFMFSGCSSLTSLNLSNFNTNNVQNMRLSRINEYGKFIFKE